MPISTSRSQCAGRTAPAPQGAIFFGSPAVLADQPVLADVALPVGAWQIAGRPIHGWEAALPNPLGFRLLLGLAVALVLIPLLVARHLIEERQKHIRTLGERQHQIDVVSRRLGLALDTSEVGVWEFNIDTELAVWDDRMNELYGLAPNGMPRN